MPIRAACVEVDISPQLPIEKPGWLIKILATKIDDPVFAKVCVIENDGVRAAIVSIDVLSIRWPQVEAIRRVAQSLGIPPENCLVAATHNHTGPAVSSAGLGRRDERYVEFMVGRMGDALRRAVEQLAPATLSVGSGIEARISSIRRMIMRDGSVRTHAPPTAEIRCPESVIDPEVGLIRIDSTIGNTIGVIVNFACHPVHNGGEPRISAGWPGQMSNALKKSLGKDCAVLFLNGAFGDVHHQSSLVPGYVDTKETVGQTLAKTIVDTLPSLKPIEKPMLAGSTKTIEIPLREIDGPFGVNMPRRQRFAKDEVYEELIGRLRAKKAKRDHVLAQMQSLRIDPQTVFVTIPGEPFSKIGLDLKFASPFRNTWVVGAANGMIGYIPTREAFDRGGYECTLSMGSKLDPSAAEKITQTGIELLREAENA
ncbi:MAG TPA: hypothetical protein VL282_16945 [Tepidisphaeraceae bacterium]|nr:hypothetical protein [Tepidisphaeraceae bacterium]